MTRQKRTPGLGDVPITRARGGTRDRLRDAGGKELALLAKAVGNSQVGALLGAATDKRDALLAFVERRLREIQMVQLAEQKELADHRDWHMRVARGVTDFTLPDPTRWHKTTLLYRRAAVALCAGDLSRGAHLLDQAVAAERAAFECVPRQVELTSGSGAPSSTPEERPFITEGESCPATKAPALFHRADAILRVTETSAPIAGLGSHRPHHWWDTTDDEVDEDKKKDSKKDAGKVAGVASPPTQEPTANVANPAKSREKAVDGDRVPGSAVARDVATSPQKRSSAPREGKE